MNRLAFVLIVLVPLLCFTPTVMAEPAWGGNCLACHDQLQPGTLLVFGEDTLADPNESVTITIDVLIPSVRSGTYYLGVILNNSDARSSHRILHTSKEMQSSPMI